ncbi:hypothetical protein SSU98_0159 [Streptococcus suis 98HAH33]|nr:hypothetical protein SSU05_0156 [Streptococcus suis 05ZYH33]ABP91319.1 hypothetical protein SSU98_0159 [Streptococcus suis 98HAH33]
MATLEFEKSDYEAIVFRFHNICEKNIFMQEKIQKI